MPRSSAELHVVPQGRGYIIQRHKGGERHELCVRGEPYAFSCRGNAEAYADLVEEDATITRNDQWMPIGTVYQGGSLGKSLRHQGA